MSISNNDKNKLYQAILALRNEHECKRFLRDLLTEPEINEFTNRWKVARMLNQKIQYEKIAKNTGMSSTTIARISKWLNNGMGGYKLILKRINGKNHSHASLSAA
jgi:TrpR-related protein YerC/YecD